MTLLPLHQVHFHGGSVSADHSCIGVYMAGSLGPGVCGCANIGETSAFVDGAYVDAYLLLEETDAIAYFGFRSSLCAVLSGEGVVSLPPAKMELCKRDANGQLLFKGDWCSKTDSPATSLCADAVRFRATFAASGVEIE